MNAEILCVGTELVLGDILNTNSQYLSRELAAVGINVYYQSAVGDNPERLVKSLSIAVSRSNLIIFTGGLGPTLDDITVATVSNALGLPLVKNEEAYQRIEKYYERIGKTMTENNKKQAFLPENSVVFQNDHGTAPGCAIESGNQCIIFLPGPPKEMKAMFEEKVMPYLKKYQNGTIRSVFVHIYGYGESKIDEMTSDLLNSVNPTVAPYAKDGETVLRITAKAQSEAEANKLIDNMLEKVNERFGDKIYGFDDESLQSVVVRELKNKKLRISTAESCTAGYISKRITDVSGSSAVFNMGISTYSNESKANELGVPLGLILEKGAVSPEVAACMAKGVRLKSGSDIGLSITGIAGPESDDTNKPVGLSYIGISDKNGEYVIESRKGGTHDREYIRYTSASEAINFVRLYLLSKNGEVENAKKYSAVLQSEIEAQKQAQKPKSEKKSTEPEQPKSVQKPKRALKVSTVYVEPEQAMPEEESVVSQAVSFDELGGKTNSKPQSSDEKLNKIIESKEYVPVVEEETELEKQYLEQLKKDFAPKEKFFKRNNLFIKRGDSAKEKARKITFWVAVVLLLVSVANIGFYYLNPFIQQKKLDSLEKQYNQNYTEDYDSAVMNPKFKELYAENKDIIGWIKIKNTNINYPVLQNRDEDYYLRKGFDGSYSREGSIFADSSSSIEYGKETKNIMLYGHHMVSTGTMFKQLDKFLDLNFYKKTPTITFDSLYRDGTYKVFAVFITNAVKEQDNGNFYDYRLSKFSSDAQFSQWINEARVRSVIDTDVEIKSTDEILTLQTCNDSFGEGDDKARLIIMARRTRKGETKTVNTSQALKNDNPRYPQIWYDEKELVNPYMNATTTAVTTKSTKATTQTSTTTTTAKTVTVAATAARTAAYVPKKTVKVTTKAETIKPTTTKTTKKVTTTVVQTTHKTTLFQTDPVMTDRFN